MLMPAILPKTGADEGYQIAHSAIFDSASSVHLRRTPGTADDLDKTTVSFWMRLFKEQENHAAIMTVGGSSQQSIRWEGTTQELRIHNGLGAVLHARMKFRDTSSWYHVHFIWDSGNATSAERMRLYVNGDRITDFITETQPTQNADGKFLSAAQHSIGDNGAGTERIDLLLSQFAIFDGVIHEPTDTGEFDSRGVWRPKNITGLTYGSQGLLLDFADSANLGNDVSGNNNDFTVTNLAAADQVEDTPTNVFSILSDIDNSGQSIVQGGTATVAASTKYVRSTMPVPRDGKIYVEAEISAATSTGQFGVEVGRHEHPNTSPVSLPGIASFGYVWHTQNSGPHGIFHNNTFVVSGIDWSSKTAQVAIDRGAGKLWFGLDNTWYDSGGGTTGNPSTGTNPTYTFTPGEQVYVVSENDTTTKTLWVNFGQRPLPSATGHHADENGIGDFDHAPPSGFLALCTKNLPELTDSADPKEDFETLLYTGTGAVRSITGLEFQPDLVWIKNRDQADEHKLVDSARGATKELSSDSTNAEATDANGLTAFNADGFSLGTGANGYNDNTEDFVAWCLKAGGAGIANTDGSISSTVSVAAPGHFSIVTYDGVVGGPDTVGHGLPAAPQLIMIKVRTSATKWVVYAESEGAGGYLTLDSTAAWTSNTGMFGNTAPTSAVFSVGNNAETNSSIHSYVAYCFRSVPGICRAGHYIGNGNADGPVVHTGFRPALMLIKDTDAAEAWALYDNERSPHNEVQTILNPDSTAADLTASTRAIDFLAAGFKVRTSNSILNFGGRRYIYLALAEVPFGGVGVSPGKAR